MISKSLFRFRTLLTLSNFIVLLCGAPAAFSQTTESVTKTTRTVTSTPSNGDTGAVAAQITNLAKALANGDAAALGSLWSDSGQYIDKDGNKYEGRSTIEKRFSSLFNVEGKRTVQLAPETTKLLSSDIAFTEGKVLVGDKKEAETRYAITLIKQNGGWLIQNAVEVPLVNDEKEISTGLSDLSWLIGSWEGAGPRATVKMTANWDADRRLIVCRYETKVKDEPSQVDIQVIGFDSSTHQPVSWHFDSRGSYGFGNWFHKGNKWTIDANGIEADGSISNATNLIDNLQPNSFSWQSVDRHVSGVHLADTNPVSVKRVQ